MFRSLVEGITDVLNEFPSKNRITQTISPATIIKGKPNIDLQRKVIVFRSCALVCTGNINTNEPRYIPSIALHRSNKTGVHYFISLHSGRITHGCDLEELAIDEHVIKRVEDLAESEK